MVLLKAVSWSAQEAWSQAAEFHKQQGLIFKSLGFYGWGNSTVQNGSSYFFWLS